MTDPIQTKIDALEQARKIIKQFEGCVLKAYPDPETGGDPWTIGFGSTTYVDGTPVKKGQTITMEVAESLLKVKIERMYQILSKRIPRWSLLNSNQQAALISFTYNCGINWYNGPGFNTISRVIREDAVKDWNRLVPVALALYVNPGGPTEVGLRRRRKAEGILFATPTTTVQK